MSLPTLSNLLSWSGQVAVIVTAALVTMKVLRLDAPAVRHLFLRIVLGACLLLPFVQPRQAAAPAGDPGTPRMAAAAAADRPASPRGASPAATNPQASFPWGRALAFAIGAGVAARLLWILVGVVRLRALRRAGEAAPRTAADEELQATIGTSAQIRYVSSLGQPVTFGLRTPIVLLPEALKDQPVEIQRAVLTHELWHVRRRDWAWTVLEESVRALLWFHPSIWMLLTHIQATREEVVDELTVLATGSRRSYVDALIVFADRQPLFAATAFARRRHLVHRIVLISKEAVMSPRRVVLFGALFLAAVCSAGWYSVQAFPLTQTADGSALSNREPGPVERRAKPVTPENPVPRRTYHVPADYPPEAETAGARGTVIVRVTLDEAGQIAETRVTGFSMTVGDRGTVSMTTNSNANLDAALNSQLRLSPGLEPQPTRAILESSSTAALRAVRQWQYAAPADGPLAFAVIVPIGPQSAGAIPPPPPPPPPAPGAAASDMAQGAVRVGGSIAPPVKLRNVNPAYPPDALAARVQGVVIIEARIEPDGRVSQTRVLRSIPMLDDAAVEAVRQWEFTPTLLNGEPVPVLMTTTVNFSLQ